jgi:hypothetical protein
MLNTAVIQRPPGVHWWIGILLQIGCGMAVRGRMTSRRNATWTTTWRISKNYLSEGREECSGKRDTHEQSLQMKAWKILGVTGVANGIQWEGDGRER